MKAKLMPKSARRSDEAVPTARANESQPPPPLILESGATPKVSLSTWLTEWSNASGQTSVRWFNTIFTQNGLNDYYYRKL